MLEDGPRQLHGHVGAQSRRQLAPEHLVARICIADIPGESTGPSHSSSLRLKWSCNTTAPMHAETHRELTLLTHIMQLVMLHDMQET